MPADKVGLYIGKFQPFHNGHSYAIKYILTQVDTLTIVIGSSQYQNQENQPFSARERRHMIEQTLREQTIHHYTIVEVPDIHDNVRWVDHLRKYVGHFDTVFTNNNEVALLFIEKDIEVRAIKALPGVSGSLIRSKLAQKANDWEVLVPKATATAIKNSFLIQK